MLIPAYDDAELLLRSSLVLTINTSSLFSGSYRSEPFRLNQSPSQRFDKWLAKVDLDPRHVPHLGISAFAALVLPCTSCLGLPCS